MPDDEIDDAEFERLRKALDSDEDLVAVLRMQLYIENNLERILLAYVPKAEHLLSELGYFKKIKVARKYDLIFRDDVTALEQVASLRNKFAHGMEKLRLTKQDDIAMVNAMKGTLRDLFMSHSTSIHGYFGGVQGVDGIPTRTALLIINARMQALADLMHSPDVQARILRGEKPMD